MTPFSFLTLSLVRWILAGASITSSADTLLAQGRKEQFIVDIHEPFRT
jgi:hypothetical protein